MKVFFNCGDKTIVIVSFVDVFDKPLFKNIRVHDKKMFL